jgi:Glycosyl transferase 4-like domain
MARRVLIVTGSYAPAMLADMHRARHLAWELPKLGWDAEVLAPDASYQPTSCLDKDSAGFFAPDTPVHFARPSRADLGILPIKGIGWRALMPMFRVGCGLLRNGHFDLVYISTSQFPLFLLGPMWEKRLCIPYVLDLHDPVFQEDRHRRMWMNSNVKHKISFWLSKYIEVRSATAAKGVVAVSPSYTETLRRRYSINDPPWLAAGRCDVIPFSVRPQDFVEVELSAPKKPVGNRPATIVYVGAGGPIMHHSFSLVCRTLARAFERRAELRGKIRIALYGTFLGWREGLPRYFADTAESYGVGDAVEEYPGRVSYRRSLELLLAGDGVLILGVDDAGYMPSKLFSYTYSGKPLLASLHRDSPVCSIVEGMRLGHALRFGREEGSSSDDAVNVMDVFLDEVLTRKTVARPESAELYGSSAMARRHAGLFEACLCEM